MPGSTAGMRLTLLLAVTEGLMQGVRLTPEGLEQPPVVAVWGALGTPAESIKCTGFFAAPNVVVTAATCILSTTPHGTVQHAACATGASECPTVPPTSLEVLSANALPERELVATVEAIAFRFSDPATMPEVHSVPTNPHASAKVPSGKRPPWTGMHRRSDLRARLGRGGHACQPAVSASAVRAASLSHTQPPSAALGTGGSATAAPLTGMGTACIRCVHPLLPGIQQGDEAEEARDAMLAIIADLRARLCV